MLRRVPALIFSLALIATLSTFASPAFPAFGDITFVSQLSLSGSTRICDVWGFVDWRTGKEYAVVGNWSVPARIWIIDVTNPAVPVEVAAIDGVSGFDVKMWQSYIYACDGNGAGNDSRIIDASDPLNPVILPGGFRSTHNIAISQSGYLFEQVTGFSIWDLNANPTLPDSMFHTGVNGHDATPKGNHRVWDFGGWSARAILWDYTNPQNPTIITTVEDTLNYFHSGDATEDGSYLYICDEVTYHPDPDIYVFDVSNPASPFEVTTIADPLARVHNLYIIGGLAFVSYYAQGFKTIDVRNPASPVVADSYDTNVSTGDNYDGAFGVYPFSPNGLIFISDWDNGLFIFTVEGHVPTTPTAVGGTPAGPSVTLHQNYPNPFNPRTTIAWETAGAGDVTLSVFDVRGRRVRTLFEGYQPAGARSVEWDGTDDRGAAVASGVYYYRLEAGSATTTKRMVLLK